MTQFTIKRPETNSQKFTPSHRLFRDGEQVMVDPEPAIEHDHDDIPVLIDVVDLGNHPPIEAQVHKCLYDEHQMSYVFEDGDTILFEHDGETHLYEVQGLHVHHRGVV